MKLPNEEKPTFADENIVTESTTAKLQDTNINLLNAKPFPSNYLEKRTERITPSQEQVDTYEFLQKNLINIKVSPGSKEETRLFESHEQWRHFIEDLRNPAIAEEQLREKYPFILDLERKINDGLKKLSDKNHLFDGSSIKQAISDIDRKEMLDNDTSGELGAMLSDIEELIPAMEGIKIPNNISLISSLREGDSDFRNAMLGLGIGTMLLETGCQSISSIIVGAAVRFIIMIMLGFATKAIASKKITGKDKNKFEKFITDWRAIVASGALAALTPDALYGQQIYSILFAIYASTSAVGVLQGTKRGSKALGEFTGLNEVIKEKFGKGKENYIKGKRSKIRGRVFNLLQLPGYSEFESNASRILDDEKLPYQFLDSYTTSGDIETSIYVYDPGASDIKPEYIPIKNKSKGDRIKAAAYLLNEREGQAGLRKASDSEIVNELANADYILSGSEYHALNIDRKDINSIINNKLLTRLIGKGQNEIDQVIESEILSDSARGPGVKEISPTYIRFLKEGVDVTGTVIKILQKRLKETGAITNEEKKRNPDRWPIEVLWAYEYTRYMISFIERNGGPIGHP